MSLFKVIPYQKEGYFRYIIATPNAHRDVIINIASDTWDDTTSVELVTIQEFLTNILNLRDSNGVIHWNHGSCKIITQNGTVLTYTSEDNPAYKLAGYLGIDLPPPGSVPNNHNMIDVD